MGAQEDLSPAAALKAADPRRGFTLRELDNFVAQVTALGFSWDEPVLVRGTFWPSSFTAPGCPFRQLAVVRTVEPPGTDT